MMWILRWMWPYRRTARAEQADAVLSVTFAAGSLVLAIWLILWLLLVRPRVLLIALEPPRETPASSRIAAMTGRRNTDDIAKLAADRQFGALRAGTLPLELDELTAFFESHPSLPVILFLSAPIATRLPEVDSVVGGRFRGILPIEAVDGKVSLDALITVIQERRRPEQKVLLILDANPLGTDPLLGLFADEAIELLRDRFEDEKQQGLWNNFGIIHAGVPGGWNGLAEGEHRTTFGLVVAESLPRIGSVSGLRRKVEDLFGSQSRTQMPRYLGDDDLGFAIPISKTSKKPGYVPASGTVNDEGTRDDLRNHLALRDDYIGRSPYRNPAAWRRYLEQLLHAERLYRAARYSEADSALRSLTDCEAELNAFPKGKYVSIASERRAVDRSLRTAVAQKLMDSLETALDAPFLVLGDDDLIRPDEGPGLAPAGAEDERGGAGTPAQAPPPPERGSGPDAGRQSLIDAVLRGENEWSAYAEGRLVEWAIMLRRQDPSFEDELRGGVADFNRATRILIMAEEAAAAAWPGYPTLDRWLASGDEARRRATDLVFLPEQARVPNDYEEFFETASRQYQRVIAYSEALDMVGQVSAELPFYLDWYARAAARNGSPQDFVALVAEVRELADFLDRTLGPAGPDETPEHDAKLRLLKSEVERRFQELQSPVRVAAASVVEDVANLRDWSWIDDLLCVPTILDPETRLALIDRARALTSTQRETLLAEAAGILREEIEEDRREKAEVAAERAREDRSDLAEAGRDVADGEVRSAIPSLWRVLFGGGDQARSDTPLADSLDVSLPSGADDRLGRAAAAAEATLLRLGVGHGGVDADHLEALSDAIAAEIWPDDDGHPAAQVAAIRSKLARAISVPPGSKERPLLNACVAAILPPAPTPAAGTGWGKFNREAWARRQTERLCGDYDLERAKDLDPNIFESSAYSIDLHATSPWIESDDRSIDLEPLVLAVEHKDGPEVPAGLGRLMLAMRPPAAGPKPPLSFRSDRGSARGTAVGIGGSAEDHEAVRFEIERREFLNSGAIDAGLRPVLFYRGQLCMDDSVPDLRLEPRDDRCEVAFASDMHVAEEKGFEGIQDQFERHPGEGYLYPDSTHTILLELRYSSSVAGARPVEVEVACTLDGEPYPVVDQFPIEQPLRVQLVSGGAPPPVQLVINAASLRDGPKTLKVEVYLVSGGSRRALVGQGSATFQLVDVASSYLVDHGYHPPNGPDGIGFFHVVVRRQESLASVPIRVMVQTPYALSRIEDIKGRPFRKEVPPRLNHFETARFIFIVEEITQELKYDVLVDKTRLPRSFIPPAHTSPATAGTLTPGMN